MSNIYLLKYNNYYNRIVRFEDAMSDYSAYILQAKTGVNFNPNDGINTKLIVNAAADEIGDYLIEVGESDATAPASRWFIMDSVRKCKGQYELTLRRDLLADYYGSVVDAPCFIEKAALQNDDPMIFNSENMTFNQIKTKETPLRDETNIPWIVGYVPKDAFKSGTVEVNAGTTIAGSQNFTADGIENFTYNGVRLYDYTASGAKTIRSYIPYNNLVLNFYSYYRRDVGGAASKYSEYGTRKFSFDSSSFAATNWPNVTGLPGWASGSMSFDRQSDAQYPDEDLIAGDQLIEVRYQSTLRESDEWGVVDGWKYDNGAANWWNYLPGTGGICSKISSVYDEMVSEGILTSKADYDAFQYLNGKIVYDSSTGTYYKISLVLNNTYTDADSYVGYLSYGSSSYNKFRDILAASTAGTSVASYSKVNADMASNANTRKAMSYRFNTSVSEYKVNFETLPNTATLDLSQSRYTLEDSPYDMFCVPYGSAVIRYQSTTTDSQGFTISGSITGDKALARSIATSIATSAGSQTIFDVQLLPYCPARYIIQSDDSLSCEGALYNPITTKGFYVYTTVTNYDETGAVTSTVKTRTDRAFSGDTIPDPPVDREEYSYTSEGLMYVSKLTHVEYGSALADLTIGVMLWCTSSNFQVQIPLSAPVTVADPKIESQTDMYRLVSPNYNGTFEFNAAKNGGISYFDVYCTYKPFNPYISVKPNFGLLYGQNFGDSRGLICGGDFSIAQVSDAWANYELSNKNYQAVFDRQIQNMEVNNSIAMMQEAVGAVTGTAQGGIAGALSGSLLGSGGGMTGGIIGAAVGTAASAAGGIVDYAASEKLRREAIDYTRDQFGYRLGNIKAIPQSLSKSSAFTANNKVFPILEYYTCTDEEKTALKQKIKYNGMTVMRIGTISEFLQDDPTYIKGQLIRLESDNEEIDYHVANEIANELYKGAFI